MNRGILVIGSANMDIVVTTPRFPSPGETLLGGDAGLFPGGKGANQAVCCAKLGARVYFAGRLGRDVFGRQILKSLSAAGVMLRHTLRDGKGRTGIALITVTRSGQNEIVVASGCNMSFTAADIRASREVFRRTCVTLLQLEIPVETVRESARLAREHGHLVILNPAPARDLPPSLLRLVDILTPNETEAGLLTGIRVTDRRTAVKAARVLLSRGVKNVIVTRGKKGSVLVNEGAVRSFPPFRVKAVDPTAAGDAFSGALACSMAKKNDITRGIRFASAVAALTVTRKGAQAAMPRSSEVRRFLKGSFL